MRLPTAQQGFHCRFQNIASQMRKKKFSVLLRTRGWLVLPFSFCTFCLCKEQTGKSVIDKWHDAKAFVGEVQFALVLLTTLAANRPLTFLGNLHCSVALITRSIIFHHRRVVRLQATLPYKAAQLPLCIMSHIPWNTCVWKLRSGELDFRERTAVFRGTVK